MDFIYLQHANPWQSRAEQATDISSKAENQFKIEVPIWGKYHILLQKSINPFVSLNIIGITPHRDYS